MEKSIHIQLMNSFAVFVGGRQVSNPFDRSRKGIALLQYLILHRGKAVGRQRLLEEFWQEDNSANPESALKTLVSRLRVQLKQICGEAGGNCIIADQGGYRWQSMPNMTVDVYEIEDIFERLGAGSIRDEEAEMLCTRLLEVYTGDLLAQSGESQSEWVVSCAASLHNRFLHAVYAYVDILKRQKNHKQIVEICRTALDIDNFDDRLHMELMRALIETDRTNEALVQYKHVIHLYYRYLGEKPSDKLREFYEQIVRSEHTVEFNLEAITNELIEGESSRGAFVCEYTVFKEVFQLQMRSLERSGIPVFLGVIMVEGVGDNVLDSIEQDKVMLGLRDILQENLRRGDTITRFSPTMFALLLPTVNYSTGNMVMDRLKRMFYSKFPNSNIRYNYLIGPLTADALRAHADKG